jgi:hypothetical protein
MTDVHFAKVSASYPRVVISSLVKRLEKPPFYHSYTFFGVWLRDHYMLLQMFTMGCAPCELRRVTTAISHSSKQGTLPIASLISKQVIPYRTCDDTCCPRVSTPKTRSLADSSMTNHELWRSQPSLPFQSLLKPQHQTSPRSPHNTTDGRPTLSTLNTSQTQHHKDEKTWTMTQDCRAKQCY